MATVWPPQARGAVTEALERAHITGANRTLQQDVAFAVDQLVEIAIRALSPAVNDTFTALTCIDWLGEGLCRVTRRWHPVRVHRDGHGFVRVITRGRQLHPPGRARVREDPPGRPGDARGAHPPAGGPDAHDGRGDHALRSASCCCARRTMIYRAGEESIPEPADLADVRRRYDEVLAAAERMTDVAAPANAEP